MAVYIQPGTTGFANPFGVEHNGYRCGGNGFDCEECITACTGYWLVSNGLEVVGSNDVFGGVPENGWLVTSDGQVTVPLGAPNPSGGIYYAYYCTGTDCYTYVVEEEEGTFTYIDVAQIGFEFSVVENSSSSSSSSLSSSSSNNSSLSSNSPSNSSLSSDSSISSLSSTSSQSSSNSDYAHILVGTTDLATFQASIDSYPCHSTECEDCIDVEGKWYVQRVNESTPVGSNDPTMFPFSPENGWNVTEDGYITVPLDAVVDQYAAWYVTNDSCTVFEPGGAQAAANLFYFYVDPLPSSSSSISSINSSSSSLSSTSSLNPSSSVSSLSSLSSISSISSSSSLFSSSSSAMTCVDLEGPLLKSKSSKSISLNLPVTPPGVTLSVLYKKTGDSDYIIFQSGLNYLVKDWVKITGLDINSSYTFIFIQDNF